MQVFEQFGTFLHRTVVKNVSVGDVRFVCALGAACDRILAESRICCLFDLVLSGLDKEIMRWVNTWSLKFLELWIGQMLDERPSFTLRGLILLVKCLV